MRKGLLRFFLNRVDGKLINDVYRVKGSVVIVFKALCPKSVVIWGGVHYNGKMNLEVLHENLNQRTHRRTYKIFFCQLSITPIYTQQHLPNNGDISKLHWPAMSPDSSIGLHGQAISGKPTYGNKSLFVTSRIFLTVWPVGLSPLSKHVEKLPVTKRVCSIV